MQYCGRFSPCSLCGAEWKFFKIFFFKFAFLSKLGKNSPNFHWDWKHQKISKRDCTVIDKSYHLGGVSIYAENKWADPWFQWCLAFDADKPSVDLLFHCWGEFPYWRTVVWKIKQQIKGNLGKGTFEPAQRVKSLSPSYTFTIYRSGIRIIPNGTVGVFVVIHGRSGWIGVSTDTMVLPSSPVVAPSWIAVDS